MTWVPLRAYGLLATAQNIGAASDAASVGGRSAGSGGGAGSTYIM